jgi:3D (Asp-Asp-Asp) domain-containing protein
LYDFSNLTLMMKPSPFLLLGWSVSTCLLSSCSTDGWVKVSRPLEPGFRHEADRALAVDDPSVAQLKLPCFFMLDAPAHRDNRLTTTSPDLNQVRTTAYCHDEQDHLVYGRLAAAGAPLRFGPVCSAAADWSRYPVGTRFRIKSQPGVVYEVDDYGSALVGSSTLDLYRPTMGSMNAWGVRAVDIEIVKWGSYEDSVRIMRDRTRYPHVRRMLLDIQKRLDQAGSKPIQTTPATAMSAPTTAA